MLSTTTLRMVCCTCVPGEVICFVPEATRSVFAPPPRTPKCEMKWKFLFVILTQIVYIPRVYVVPPTGFSFSI